jgi:hypothetical protein
MGRVRSHHKKLMRMKPVTRDNLGKCDFPGVYLFSQKRKPLYAGRARNVRKRLLQHSLPSVIDAPFAFKLARKATGKTQATYKVAGGRKELLADPDFRRAFLHAKDRIARMHIRYVEVGDDLEQALLEIYTSAVLGTPHNDFGTT